MTPIDPARVEARSPQSRYIDLTGQRFGRLTALRPDGRQGRGMLWLCQCDCGRLSRAQAGALRIGQRQSCGCSRVVHVLSPGQRFGHLECLRPCADGDGGDWHVRCDCGREYEVPARALGKVRSCGCRKAELLRATKVTHGASGQRGSGPRRPSPEYRTWAGMIRRCENPAGHDRKNYAGRGIAVCERWRESFEAFLADMGPKPRGLSIDRIDNNGNYEPGNCRWATAKEQRANQRPRSEWGRT